MCLVRLDLQHQLDTGAQFVLNPAAHMCWTDEDVVGKVARLSRRTHPLSTARRTIDRALCSYRRMFGDRFGASYLREAK
jgi:hypothetical protein